MLSLKKKINDFFNVKKYKKENNSLKIKYAALNEEQLELLKSDRSMLNENIDLKNQIKDLKKEIKDLKRIIEESKIKRS